MTTQICERCKGDGYEPHTAYETPWGYDAEACIDCAGEGRLPSELNHADLCGCTQNMMDQMAADYAHGEALAEFVNEELDNSNMAVVAGFLAKFKHGAEK